MMIRKEIYELTIFHSVVRDSVIHMSQNKLFIFLDSESIDSNYDVKKDEIERLISISNLPLDIRRTPLSINQTVLKKVKTCEEKEGNDIMTIMKLRDQIFRKTFTEGEAKFVLLMLKYSSIQKKYVRLVIKNAVYVTENKFLLANYLALHKRPSLNQFFPLARIVNVNQALELLDLFAKSHGLYFGTRSETDLTSWYQIHLYTKSSYFPVIYKNTIHNQPTKPSQTIQALIFRFLKALLCIDYLGIQHHFGHSRKASFDLTGMYRGVDELRKGSTYPVGLGPLIDLDDLLVIFYHVEYFISLVTGIFDNLAVETCNHYEIKDIPTIRTSLSTSAGKDFLKEVNNQNPDLKKHIDNNRPFINLIYEFRDKVVHREGLKRIISPIGTNWSNLMIVNHQIKDYLKQSGDRPSCYKIVSDWGLVEREKNLYLDPFYFSNKVMENLIIFADKYLQLLGYKALSTIVDFRDTVKKAFIRDVEYFKNTSLRA
jgi:hypothetical protein